MDGVRVYHRQPGGPQSTVLVAFYGRYQKEKGPSRDADFNAICFGEYLLNHLEQFQAELKDYMSIPWPDPSQ
jgi:hypothetical protein